MGPLVLWAPLSLLSEGTLALATQAVKRDLSDHLGLTES